MLLQVALLPCLLSGLSSPVETPVCHPRAVSQTHLLEVTIKNMSCKSAKNSGNKNCCRDSWSQAAAYFPFHATAYNCESK